MQGERRELSFSRLEVRDLVDDCAVGFLALDRSWRVAYANPAATELLQDDAVEGRVLWDRFPEALGSAFESCYRTAFATEEPVAFTEFYAPLGRWFSVHAIPLPTALCVYFHHIDGPPAPRSDADGGAAGGSSAGGAHDDLVPLVSDGLSDGVVTISDDGVVTYANPAAGRLLRRSLEWLVGMRAHHALYGGLVTPGRAALAAGGEAQVRMEADTFVRGDGRRIAVDWTAARLPGDPCRGGRVLTFRDAATTSIGAERERRERDRLRWAARIRQALFEDRFTLVGQPIVDLRTGRTTSHELLIRMREGGAMVSPAAFLPAAEEHGLIGEVDAWVIGQAVALAATGMPVHCNLSSRSVASERTLGVIARALEQRGADSGLVTFEITETAMAAEREEATRFAACVQALGCRVALDDFGTGYNSFARIDDLPVDEIKIDMGFVQDLATRPKRASVVRSIAAFAADLGVPTIGEGIEDAETVGRLLDLGVTHGQGYHLGRPAPLELAR